MLLGVQRVSECAGEGWVQERKRYEEEHAEAGRSVRIRRVENSVLRAICQRVLVSCHPIRDIHEEVYMHAHTYMYKCESRVADTVRWQCGGEFIKQKKSKNVPSSLSHSS